MQEFLNQLPGGEYVLSIGAALLILVVGWIIALIAAAAVRRALKKTAIDERLSDRLGLSTGVSLSRIAGSIVFWLIMVFAIIAVFQSLRLTAVTGPLNSMLDGVFAYAPNLLAAIGLTAAALLVATLLRLVVSRALGATTLDERLAAEAGVTGTQPPLSETIGGVLYWLVLLLFLPAILGALRLEGLLAPVQGMVGNVLGYLPNFLGATVILLIGWLIARVVRQIISNLLRAAGADRLGQRMGMAGDGAQTLSSVAGTVIYVLVLLPVIIAALQALQIEAISRPATDMLTALMGAIPSIFGAMIILGLSYFVAKLVSGLVTSLLSSIGFDRVLGLIGLGREEPPEGARTPSEIAGMLVLLGLMLFAAIEASNMLGFGFVATLVTEFTAFAGKVLLGLIILGVGLYLANLAHAVVRSTAGSQAHLLSQVARAAIVVLSAAMALRQMGLADDIVNLAFGIVLGAIAIAFAIAFGMGGREAASREVERMISKMRK